MEWVIGIICLIGGAFSVIAGLGVLRLQDVLIRMHASTKAGTLASGIVLLAVALHFRDAEVTAKAVLAVLFLLLTAPIAAHMIGRAAMKLGVPLWQTDYVALDDASHDNAPQKDSPTSG
ncbi:MAG: monovalent cation/H(+) antiporter subunit G [Pseudomonadota bacterium]